MSLYQIKNRAYDRMEHLCLSVKNVVNISYQFFFSKEKKCQKSLCFLKIRRLTLHALTCCFMTLRGARGPSHIVILFNPLRPKSDLNEIYHLSVREIMRIEKTISQVNFC